MSQDQETSHTTYEPDAWLRTRRSGRAGLLTDDERPAPGGWSDPVVAPVEPSFPLSVARRTTGRSAPAAPARALAGALVAVAGVLLGIGALLWATHAPAARDQVPVRTAPAALAGSTRQLQPAPADTASAPAANPVRPAPVVVTSAVRPAARPAAGQFRTAAPPRPALTVLNNSTRPRLADVAAARFRAGGWPVARTGNFRGRIPVTTVYYAAGQFASAQLLQRTFGGLTRVRPRYSRLPGHGLTVVLTRSYR